MKTILAYGDSNTYGFNPQNGLRYSEDIRWTGRLAKSLASDYKIIEEGCNGRNTVFYDPIDGWKNGLDYLKPCLNSHKPIDIVILMLGSNDLKEMFHATTEKIAEGVETLVKTINSFTEEKQGYKPSIVLISPIEIGSGIKNSPFYGRFSESAIERSKEFPKYYKDVAERYGCIFFNAAEWVKPSELDSLHMDSEGHRIFAEKLEQIIKENFSER